MRNANKRFIKHGKVDLSFKRLVTLCYKDILRKHKVKEYLDIVKIYTKDGRIVQGKNPLFEDTSVLYGMISNFISS